MVKYIKVSASCNSCAFTALGFVAAIRMLARDLYDTFLVHVKHRWLQRSSVTVKLLGRSHLLITSAECRGPPRIRGRIERKVCRLSPQSVEEETEISISVTD